MTASSYQTQQKSYINKLTGNHTSERQIIEDPINSESCPILTFWVLLLQHTHRQIDNVTDHNALYRKLTVPQIMCWHVMLHNAATHFTLHHKSAFSYNVKNIKKILLFKHTLCPWQLLVNTISVHYSIVFKLPLFVYCVIPNKFCPAHGHCKGHHSHTVVVITAGIP